MLWSIQNTTGLLGISHTHSVVCELLYITVVIVGRPGAGADTGIVIYWLSVILQQKGKCGLQKM
jgi:hypothetical protein